jgi:hypothetical protein
MMSLENENKLTKDLKENRGGFQIPENYLDGFNSEIMKKIQKFDEPESKMSSESRKIVRFQQALKILLPLAAILLMSYFLFYDNANLNDGDVLSNEMSWDEFAIFDESWIVSELSDIETESDTTAYDSEIDFLLADGVTTSEIIEVYNELP